MRSNVRGFERESSSIFSVLSSSGGIRPPDRKRSWRALSLAEREEISRGLVAGRSLRAIAVQLGAHRPRSAGRSAVTVALIGIVPRCRIRRHGIVRCARSAASLLATQACDEQYRASCAANGRQSGLRVGSSIVFRTKTSTACHTKRSTRACIFRRVASSRKSCSSISGRSARSGARVMPA